MSSSFLPSCLVAVDGGEGKMGENSYVHVHDSLSDLHPAFTFSAATPLCFTVLYFFGYEGENHL